MDQKYVRLDEIAAKFKYKNLTPRIDLHEVKIYHRNINRPAFQLTGFYDYFDDKRVQVIGRAEHEYLIRLEHDVAKERVEKLCSYAFPAAIIARGIDPPQHMLDIAEKTGSRSFLPKRQRRSSLLNS